MAAQGNNVKFNASSIGTVDFVFASGIALYQTPVQANLVSGQMYEMFALDTSNNWEIVQGILTISAGPTYTFARTTVLYNSAQTGTKTPGQSGAGTKINFASIPIVSVTLLKESVALVDDALGALNGLRNSSLTSWFHGSATLTITTAGAWGAEGIYIVPTGASVAASQQSNPLTNPLSVFCQRIVGATSVTGLVTRFVIDSHDVARAGLSGNQVTFQLAFKNTTGGTVTPAITVKHANAQDNFGATTTDVAAVSLQPVATGAQGTIAYTWASPSGAINGLSINIDWGNNFSSNAKFIEIGGGFDIRATPSLPTGLCSNPPAPKICSIVEDDIWNKRFFEASYDNGVTPGTTTTTSSARWEVDTLSSSAKILLFNNRYTVQKRATAPTVVVYSTNGGATGNIRDEGNSINIAGTISNNGDKSFDVGGTFGTASSFYRVSYHWTSDASLVGA